MDSPLRRLHRDNLDKVGLRELQTNAAQSTTATQSAATPSSTIASFDTGLDGVDQSENLLFSHVLWGSLGVVGLVILGVRLAEIGWHYLRLITAMSRPAAQQTYWTRGQWWMSPKLKRNIIYAPLGKKRHNREIRLSKAINVGTLPSRLHAILLGLYFVSNLVYLFWLDYATRDRFSLSAELRGRAGTMAVVNLLPLIIFAGRNNPLIGLLKISFDTYNLLHRWMGRTVVFEVVLHFAAWAYVQVAAGGWSSAYAKMAHDRFIASGTGGFMAMVILLVLSLSPIRHAFYETFLNTHIILAFIIIATACIHCSSTGVLGGIPQLPWVYVAITIWAAERTTRMVRLAFFNWSRRGFTEAKVQPMPANACRVTIQLPSYVDVQPGTHAYLRFANANPWESHPFSIAWVEHQTESTGLPRSEKDAYSPPPRRVSTSVSFVIGAQTGLTRKLYDKARATGQESMITRAAFEGPYAGHHVLDSYGHIVLIAGATGITHQISYLRHLVEGFANGTVATRRILLVWIVRDLVALDWVQPWMQEVLRLPRRREVLHIRLHVTKPNNTRETTTTSNSIAIFPGRPNMGLMLEREVHRQIGAMIVSVCGPGALADDVRQAVREVQDSGNDISFIEEAFTW
jgi:predicted ferric reductase